MEKENLFTKCKQLTEENRELKTERIISRIKISNQRLEIESLQRELEIKNFDVSCIPPIQITSQVTEWLSEYGMPWEVFYCDKCKSWFTELDTLFPWGIDNSGCKCDQQED
ncbi:hypothetical protein AB7340_20875 [Providencia alcalifaciens]|uniref:hypothetical protein n=1 Tax=unclassified Providencia TaxID=2633465 RepID=UPI0034E71E72